MMATVMKDFFLIIENENDGIKIEDQLDTSTESFDEAIEYARQVWAAATPDNRKDWLTIKVTDGETERFLYRRDMKLTDLVDGYYASDGKRYRVQVPKAGNRWHGFIFIKTGSDYHESQTVATITPNGLPTFNTNEHGRKVAKSLAIDPAARMAEYGQITGTCGRCGRKLEDETSRALGLGPVCRGAM